MRFVCLLLVTSAFAQTRESIEKQLKSIEQQRESLRRMQPLPQPAGPACDPMPEAQAEPLIASAAKARQLPAKLLRAVVEQESGFRPCAVSEKGAQGLMQLMPATAARFEVKDAFDPQANLAAGAAFLRELLEKYKGSLPEALAAYNAGPDTVDKAGAIPDIPETRAYIDAIVDKVGTKQIDLAPRTPPEKP